MFLSLYQNIRYSRPSKSVPEHTVQQALSTLYMVQALLAIFGLHVDTMQFNTQGEE